VIMIVLAVALLLVAKYMMNRLRLPWTKVWPVWERRLSKGLAARSKDILTFVFLFVIVILPSFYIFAYLTAPSGVADLNSLFGAIGISFAIAGIAVVFNIVFGIPMAIYIARNGNTRLGVLLDNLVNIPLIIPTTVLGLSLSMFWGSFNLPAGAAFFLVTLGHISFTYPLVVRNITGAISEVDPSYEEVARTLGAKPFRAFSKVLLPIVQSSVIAGAILAFTRSLGETGATISISKDVVTVPVYIMDLIEQGQYYQGAVAAMILIVICFILMFGVRYLTGRRKQGA